jgi:hypothetical protein
MHVTWVEHRLASEIDDRYVYPDTATQIAETDITPTGTLLRGRRRGPRQVGVLLSPTFAR